MLRVLYVGRLSLATAIFLAAIVVWRAADSTATLIATLAFVSALLFTAASMMYSGTRVARPGDRFFYVQVLFDLLLVWAPDEKLRHRILVENPAVLYDFPKNA